MLQDLSQLGGGASFILVQESQFLSLSLESGCNPSFPGGHIANFGAPSPRLPSCAPLNVPLESMSVIFFFFLQPFCFQFLSVQGS